MRAAYPKSIEVPDAELEALASVRDPFRGASNCTISPISSHLESVIQLAWVRSVADLLLLPKRTPNRHLRCRTALRRCSSPRLPASYRSSDSGFHFARSEGLCTRKSGPCPPQVPRSSETLSGDADPLTTTTGSDGRSRRSARIRSLPAIRGMSRSVTRTSNVSPNVCTAASVSRPFARRKTRIFPRRAPASLNYNGIIQGRFAPHAFVTT